MFIVAVQFVALGVIGDILAGSRAFFSSASSSASGAWSCTGVEPSHYEPGASETGQAATTGAQSGRATGKTEDREAAKT